MTDKPALHRRGGILLHPSSLPGPLGMGDLGDSARHFVDWLNAGGQRVWQVLPLTPVGPEFSPYTSTSVHAGNPLLVSPWLLAHQGLLQDSRVRAAESEYESRKGRGLGQERSSARAHADGIAAGHFVDVDAMAPLRMSLLREAARCFAADADAAQRQRFDRFCAENADWLGDYALFMALYDDQQGRAWNTWPAEWALRDVSALAHAREAHADAIHFWSFVQWIFDDQWQSLRDYANARDVALIGDVPIYCAQNSADVWSNPSLFMLDASGASTVVAGVPPDYFSADGQKWGNPLYDWARHADTGFAWWRGRFRTACRQTDLVRIDHFRGLAAYWEVPADAPTAKTGRWMPGPGQALFDALRLDHADTGVLPLLAEDLGIITDDVVALRRAIDVPGMAVLQFAFGDDARNPYLPHNIDRDTVIYTGTHDNDTTRGWFEKAPESERSMVQRYLRCSGESIEWSLMHCASQSVARISIAPMQDVLGLGSDARMNMPGVADDQWRWRFQWSQVQSHHADSLKTMAIAHGRYAE